MTVAAAILAATPESALRDVDGVPNVRRLTDVAWAGGAVPVIVVAADPDGDVVRALAGSAATYAEPAPAAAGPVGQISRAIDLARSAVSATDAALVWPARMGWVDAETVTSLIEAHGVEPDTLLRPTFRGEAGWPALVPTAHLETLRGLSAELMPAGLVEALAAAVPTRLVDLGDPGVVHDLDTSRAELPPFEGPPEPAAGHVHEWGSMAAEHPDDAPLEGPALAPYGQAVAEVPDQPG